MPAVRCDRVENLTDKDFLSTLLGPVRDVEPTSMGTPGFSGSTHLRVGVTLEDGDLVSLVLKRTRLDADWTAYRSGDSRGREAMLLSSPELQSIWDVFASPYLAFAVEGNEVGLLMHDLAPYLLPDVREPMEIAAEDALFSRIARLHAAHWERPLPEWLAGPPHHFSLLGPAVIGDDPRRALPSPFRERVAEGWHEAFARLPGTAAKTLRLPAEEHEARFAHLPRTLVHGDVKVANFAYLPGDRIAAFDWAMAGGEPASIDLGWYLAVNASRLARPKEGMIDRYRDLLEAALGRSLDRAQWADMQSAAYLGGALMLLWSKALALRDGRDGAQAEWDWWVCRIPG